MRVALLAFVCAALGAAAALGIGRATGLFSDSTTVVVRESPTLVPSGLAAAAIADDLALHWPLRTPGSPGAAGAARWFGAQLTPNGFTVQTEDFTAA
ncbi:MAG TPA: hypothetical protein VFC97_03945, partial [Verrucomicrobiae bacterium]|nr:hypothetical protein [Verrucomicrobiae bacterium]